MKNLVNNNCNCKIIAMAYFIDSNHALIMFSIKYHFSNLCATKQIHNK